MTEAQDTSQQQTGEQAMQAVIDDVLSQNADQKAETKAVTKPLDSYPAEKQRSIRSYLNAVDQKLKNFVQRVKGGDLTFKREKISDVSDRAAKDIGNLLGIDVSGYTNNINTNGVQHILNRHGENGEHDSTMSIDDDIARIGWVLENYDTVELLTENGEQVHSSEFRDNNDRPAPQIRFVKKIDGTYYVVEAVCENKYKKLWVQGTYLQKNEDVTQAPAEGKNTNHETNAQSDLASPSSISSIHQTEPGVNSEVKKVGADESVGAEVDALAMVEELVALGQGEAPGEQAEVDTATQRHQPFEADLSQYDERTRATVQRAIDCGILNNTKETHEFVDLVAKISADKGVSFDFVNNARLRASGFALEGVTVNGFVDHNSVTLNIDSAKALNSVVGHEITHVLEGTELYDVLKSSIIEYAKSKGEYDSRLQSLKMLYEGKEGYTGEGVDTKIEQELVADLVGDYLFTDPNFIRNLSTKHRNVFEKLFDEIKYLCKIATAGSKEARQLEKVKKAFAEAYRVDGEVVESTKYALAKIEDVTPSQEQIVQNIKKVAYMDSVYTVDKGKLYDSGKDIKAIYRDFFDTWGENIQSDVFGDIATKNQALVLNLHMGTHRKKLPLLKQFQVLSKKERSLIGLKNIGDYFALL